MLKFECFNINEAQLWQTGGPNHVGKKNCMNFAQFRWKIKWNVLFSSCEEVSDLSSTEICFQPVQKGTYFFRCLNTTGSVAFSRQPEWIRGRAMLKDNAPPRALKFKNYSPIRNAPIITIICYLTAVIGGSRQLCAECYEYIEEEEKK